MSIQAIRHAIRRKEPITATYLGRRRILCPHAIGTKHGVWNVLSYQSGGQSSSDLSGNPAHNWRCMRVSELSRVAPIECPVSWAARTACGTVSPSRATPLEGARTPLGSGPRRSTSWLVS